LYSGIFRARIKSAKITITQRREIEVSGIIFSFRGRPGIVFDHARP
jgi:hypothetical protein